MLFYGHTPPPEDGKPRQRQQWAALPLDTELRKWQTVDIGLAPGKSGIPAGIAPSWTDMFVFRESGRTFAIFKTAGGLVVEAQNAELTRWKAIYCRIVFNRGIIAAWETGVWPAPGLTFHRG